MASPQVLTLNFSEGIEPGFSGVVVTDAQNQVIKAGTATRDEKNKAQLTVPLEQTLAPGLTGWTGTWFPSTAIKPKAAIASA